jgi:tRNA threonylcarbamoyladenosine biosynthesis protein TsaE
MRYLTRGARETFEFGAALGAELVAGDVVLLSGDLGAGKSVLARGIAFACGIAGPMPSPTFTIMIPYEGDGKFYHFDLYRLADPDEFYAAGLEEFLGGDGIAVVEWPEMADLNPAGAIRVTIARGEREDERMIEADARRALERWEAQA